MNPLHVGVSALYLRPGRVGGVEQFLYNALKGIEAAGEDGMRITVYGSAPALERVGDLGLSRIDLEPREIPERWASRRFLAETFLLPRLLRHDDVDIVWFPNYFCPPGTGCPSVVTIHDLLAYDMPAMLPWPKRIWMRTVLPLSIRNATAIATISETSARAIEKRFPDARVHAIHTGFPFEPIRREPDDTRRRKKRILIVSRQYPHKNIDTVVRALSYLPADAYALDIVGQRDEGTDDILRAVADLGNAYEVRHHDYVTRTELERLQRRADALVCPSTFEGFGMPVVEAMLVGTKVVVSDIPVLREVTLGMADAYVASYRDPQAWSSAISSTMAEPDRETGSSRVERIEEHFALHRFGRQYVDLFRGTVMRSRHDLHDSAVDAERAGD